MKFDSFLDAVGYAGLINIFPSQAKEQKSILKFIENTYEQLYSKKETDEIILFEIKKCH